MGEEHRPPGWLGTELTGYYTYACAERRAMSEVEEFQERAAAIKHTLEVAKQDYHLRMELDDRRNFMQIEWALWELCAQVAKLREQS